MKIHRFYLPESLALEKLEIKDKNLIHQLNKVLKLKAGEKIILFNGRGEEALGAIEKITNHELSITIEKLENKENLIKNKVTLCCAILKKENFELVVQKATEIGVNMIVPLITARTIKTRLNLERLNKIIIEASEQSGRVTIPEISEPIKFEKAVMEAKGTNYFFHTDEDLSNGSEGTLSEMAWEPSFAKATEGQGAPVRRNLSEGGSTYFSESSVELNLWIGPEGGWTDEEVKLAKENGFKIASLGPLTLRAETAAIISAYLAVNQ
jgi:16S rRNA (uracil1498-N3)-methyltransferase